MKKSGVLILMVFLSLVLTCCGSVSQLDDKSSEESSDATSSMSEATSSNKLIGKYAKVLTKQYHEIFQDHGIEIAGENLIINDDHTFTFNLLLENQSGGRLSLPVSGVYEDDILNNDKFARATWGGVARLDDTILAVFTKGKVGFYNAKTLEEARAPITLTDYNDCWILGVCRSNTGYIFAVGGEDLSCLVYVNEGGEIIATTHLYHPYYFRIKNRNYSKKRFEHTAGFAFNTYPHMEAFQFDSPKMEAVLLERQMVAAWAAMEGIEEGQLDGYQFVEPENGVVIEAYEKYYHKDGSKKYVLLTYTTTKEEEPSGHMGMYYENGIRKLSMMTPGPPSYPSAEMLPLQWKIEGKQAYIENPSGCEYIKLDFEGLQIQIEYRFTPENLIDAMPLATSPDGRYSLQGVNISGAGDGYWGQVVLIDNETGDIAYVRNLPVRFANDSESTNFADSRTFTMANGQILYIHSVTAPTQYRTVRLDLPRDDSNITYCNSIYDAENNRYFLAYLENVELDLLGRREYSDAAYHLAVFDSDIQLIQDVVVPGVLVTNGLYSLPCPKMEWDGVTLTLDGTPVNLAGD